MGTNTNSRGYYERAREEKQKKWNKGGWREKERKRNRVFKLSSRKIDIFAYIPRIRPLVDVIKRNKAHLHGTPHEYSESVGSEIPKIGRK